MLWLSRLPAQTSLTESSCHRQKPGSPEPSSLDPKHIHCCSGVATPLRSHGWGCSVPCQICISRAGKSASTIITAMAGTTTPQDARAEAKVLPLGIRECLGSGCSTRTPTRGKGGTQQPINNFWKGRSRWPTKNREVACSVAVCYMIQSALCQSRIFLKSHCYWHFSHF